MPDLLTHGAVAVLIELGLARRGPARLAPLFIAGNLLPDLMARVPAIVMGEVDSKLFSVPRLLIYGWEPLHQPGGMLLAALALAMLFRPGMRRAAFLRLYLGMLLHLGMDLFQHHEGAGHLLFFPLWHRAFEIGWFGSEDSVWVALPLAVLALAWWLIRRRAFHTALRETDRAG